MPFAGRRSKSRPYSRGRLRSSLDGIIKSRDVIWNLPLIWKEFGTGCALRALRAVVTRQRTTFLDVACNCEEMRARLENQPRA